MDEASGRWNSFQRTMFQWNDLHPYNAVHVLRIAGALDLTRLQSAVCSVVQGRGLTGLVIDRARGSYRYEGGPLRGEIKLLGHETGGLQSLAREI